MNIVEHIYSCNRKNLRKEKTENIKYKQATFALLDSQQSCLRARGVYVLYTQNEFTALVLASSQKFRRERFNLSYVILHDSPEGIRRIYFSLKDILRKFSRKKSIFCFRDSGHGVNNSPVYPPESHAFLPIKGVF